MILMNLTAFTVAKFFYKVYSSGINLILNFKAFGKYYFLQCQKSVGKKVNPYEMYYLGNLEKQDAPIIRTTYCLLKISSRHRLRRLSIKTECQAGKKEKDY